VQATQIIPLDKDVPGITRAAEDFKHVDDTITRKIDKVLVMTMNAIYELNQRQKSSQAGPERQEVRNTVPGSNDPSAVPHFVLLIANVAIAKAGTFTHDVRRDVAIPTKQRDICSVGTLRYDPVSSWSVTYIR